MSKTNKLIFCLKVYLFSVLFIFFTELFFFFFLSFLLQRLIQYLASRNTLFNLNNFLDKGALQGKAHKHSFSQKSCENIRVLVLF